MGIMAQKLTEMKTPKIYVFVNCRVSPLMSFLVFGYLEVFHSETTVSQISQHALYIIFFHFFNFHQREVKGISAIPSLVSKLFK